MKKRILVNAAIVVVLALIGYYCYNSGRAYNLIVENLPYTAADGTEHPGIEALQVYIDDQSAPVYLLEGDRLVATAVGKGHTLRIEILDEEDKPIESISVPFTVAELKGTPRELNVAEYFYKGKAKVNEKTE